MSPGDPSRRRPLASLVRMTRRELRGGSKPIRRPCPRPVPNPFPSAQSAQSVARFGRFEFEDDEDACEAEPAHRRVRPQTPDYPQPLGQRPPDLVPFGEAARLLLREDELAVLIHLEHAAAAGDDLQCGHAGLEQAQDLLRQTDGPGQVASHGAVFDPNLHRNPFRCITGRPFAATPFSFLRSWYIRLSESSIPRMETVVS